VRPARRSRWSALIPLVLIGADAPAPKHPAPKRCVCHRAEGPVAVDGRLDEAAWGRAAWTDAFVDIEGAARPLPRFATRAKMLWDDRYFYVAAELEELDVWGTLTDHDAVIFQDNDFEVFIDPDGDNHEYYEFEINALNTGWDLLLRKPYRDGGPAENAWEIPGLKTAVAVRGTLNRPGDRDEGWTVELAFPWAALAPLAHTPCPPAEGDSWRVNFSRVEWRHLVVDGRYEKVPKAKEDNWVWSPQGVVDMHRPERWGYVQFTRGEPGRVPTVPDPTGPARDRLHEVYYAQKAYRERTKRWASSLAELGIAATPTPSPTIRPAADGYEATTTVMTGPGETREIAIGADSRIRLGPVRPARSIDVR